MKQNKIIIFALVGLVVFFLLGLSVFFLGGQQKKSQQSGNIDVNSTSSQSEKVAKSVVNSSGADVDCTQIYNDLFQKSARDFEKCGVFADKISCDDEQSQKPKVQNNVIVILDSSGSMAGQIDGRAKIDIAKEAAWKFLDDLDGSDIKLSVLVYGHKGSNNAIDKKLSCESIEEIYYFGELDSAVAKNKINQFKPTGWTPIADSLSKASQILASNTNPSDKNSILLISDGIETCDGDPIGKATELRNNNQITTNVIAFDVTGDAETQLKNISQGGGGNFYSARSMEEMFAALAEERDKFWQKYECESEQWSEWLDKSLDTSFIGSACSSDLHWEQWDMVDMGVNMMNDVPEACKKSVADTYRQMRYQPVRETLIQNYIRSFLKVNSTMNDQEIWTMSSGDNNNELLSSIENLWSHEWDQDLDWSWVEREIQSAVN